MSQTKVDLEDAWTSSTDYKDLFQTNEGILNVIELLDLDESLKLLDNGCGNGEFSLHAAQRYPGLQVYGFDGLDSAISEANKRAIKLGHKELHYSVAWADSLPLGSNTIDRALFRFVLHHIEDPKLPFAEMSRCMKDSSKLIIQTPFNFWHDEMTNFLREMFLIMDNSHSRHYHTLQTITGCLEEVDFNIESSSSSSFPFPYISEPMKNLIVSKGYEDLLNLTSIEEGLWSINLYELQVVATKSK